MWKDHTGPRGRPYTRIHRRSVRTRSVNHFSYNPRRLTTQRGLRIASDWTSSYVRTSRPTLCRVGRQKIPVLVVRQNLSVTAKTNLPGFGTMLNITPNTIMILSHIRSSSKPSRYFRVCGFLRFPNHRTRMNSITRYIGTIHITGK
jgi:hypothetical protein